MVKNLTRPTIFSSLVPPNPEEVDYWIDLLANAKGNIIKFWDGNIRKWVKLTDASSEYAIAPHIGTNGNWFVENRDTGIKAYGYAPIVGDNGNWWQWDAALGKYIDTGVSVEGPIGPVGPQGKSAYEVALDNAFVGTEDEWLASLRKASEDAAELANAARDAAILATTDSIEATAETRDATANAKSATIDAVMSAANAGNAADTARTSAIAANNAAASANLSANAANTAAATANTAVDAANTATQNANLATAAADAVVSEAHVAIDEINDKLVKADTAIADANTSAGNADTAAGNANASAATANSAAQVALDAAANVKDGKTPVIGEISAASVATDQPAVFELTNSGQIDEHGNPIYIGSAEFPIGADGKSPFMETGTTTTGNAGTNANVVVTPNGSTADGRPKFKLDFTIPRGATGEPGSGSGNAVIVNFADATNSKQYVLKPQADGSLNYILEEVDITLSDELSVVYVSKTGNDTNSGRNILHPKLTISNAIITASALITGATTKASVVVIDAGVYTETISLVDDVSLVAERATIVGRINLRNRTRVSVHAHYAAASSTYMLYKDGTDHAYYNAVISDGRGLDGTLTTVSNVYNVTASSITFTDIQLMFVSANGIGIREESSTIGHIHFNIKDLYLSGNNACGIRASGTASNIIGYFDHILETTGTFTNTRAIDIRQPECIVKVTGGEIIVDQAWNIANGKLYLTCPKVDGTKTGTPTNFISGSWNDLLDKPTDLVTDADITIVNNRIADVESDVLEIHQDITDLDISLNGKSTKLNLPQFAIPYRDDLGFGETNAYLTPVGNAATPGTIVVRTDAGKVKVGAATESNDAIQKAQLDSAVTTLNTAVNAKADTSYVNTQLDNKGSKLSVNGYSIPYNSSSEVGEPLSSLRPSQIADNSSIVQRTPTGQIRATAPLADGDVVNKLYLDGAINDGISGIPVVTTGTNGLMIAADKVKLNGIVANANNYVHPTGDGNSHIPATGTANNGKVLMSGNTANSAAWQTLTKANVGLNNVDNTSDINKPISTATQTALNKKADIVDGKVPTSQLPELTGGVTVETFEFSLWGTRYTVDPYYAACFYKLSDDNTIDNHSLYYLTGKNIEVEYDGKVYTINSLNFFHGGYIKIKGCFVHYDDGTDLLPQGTYLYFYLNEQDWDLLADVNGNRGECVLTKITSPDIVSTTSVFYPPGNIQPYYSWVEEWIPSYRSGSANSSSYIVNAGDAATHSITASTNVDISISGIDSMMPGVDLVIRVVGNNATNRTITLPTTGVINETGMTTAIVNNIKSLELNIKRFGDTYVMKGVLYE